MFVFDLEAFNIGPADSDFRVTTEALCWVLALQVTKSSCNRKTPWENFTFALENLVYIFAYRRLLCPTGSFLNFAAL